MLQGYVLLKVLSWLGCCYLNTAAMNVPQSLPPIAGHVVTYPESNNTNNKDLTPKNVCMQEI